MNAWTVVLLAGLGCYVLRVSMVASDRLRLPTSLEPTFALVAPTAFSALAVTGLAGPLFATPAMSVVTPTIVAAVVGILAVAGTGKPYAAMLTGLPTYWLIAAQVS
jgi:branched-subunit amino acid transport protein